jgi:hypothetical protein
MQYQQATGKLYDDNNDLIGIGWAGHQAGRNNPQMQDIKDVGPLPVGKYVINDPINSPKLGPEAFSLMPDSSNKMFGRSAFYIHGASITNPAMSSDGCIVMPRPTRDLIGTKIAGSPLDSPLRVLTVV